MTGRLVPKEHKLRLKRATRVWSTFTHSIYKRKRRKENQIKAKKIHITMLHVTDHMGIKSTINIFL